MNKPKWALLLYPCHVFLIILLKYKINESYFAGVSHLELALELPLLLWRDWLELEMALLSL